jgi:cation transport ATPase
MKLIGTLLSILLVVALVVNVAVLVATAATVYGLFWVGRRLVQHRRARAADAAHARAELLARAELQNRWYLDGDPRGVHGRYAPAAVDG